MLATMRSVPHHAETLKLSCGMLSVSRRSKLKIGLDHGKEGIRPDVPDV